MRSIILESFFVVGSVVGCFGQSSQSNALQKFLLIFILYYAILNLICMYHFSIFRYPVRRKQLSILFLIFAGFFACSQL